MGAILLRGMHDDTIVRSDSKLRAFRFPVQLSGLVQRGEVYTSDEITEEF